LKQLFNATSILCLSEEDMCQVSQYNKIGEQQVFAKNTANISSPLYIHLYSPKTVAIQLYQNKQHG